MGVAIFQNRIHEKPCNNNILQFKFETYQYCFQPVKQDIVMFRTRSEAIRE